MATKLDQISEQFRKESITRNSYNEKNLYNSQNLTTFDELINE